MAVEPLSVAGLLSQQAAELDRLHPVLELVERQQHSLDGVR